MMSHCIRNRSLIASVIALTVALTILVQAYIRSSDEPDTVPSVRATEALEVSDLAKENERLREENQRLRLLLEAGRRDKTQSSAQSPKAHLAEIPLARSTPHFTEEQVRRILSAQRESDQFIERYFLSDKGSDMGYEERLHSDFDKEIRDIDWAPQYESAVAEIFNEHEMLSDFVLDRLECRSSRCKISLRVDSSDQADNAISSLGMALEDDHVLLRASSISAAMDLDHGVVDLYITGNNTHAN